MKRRRNTALLATLLLLALLLSACSSQSSDGWESYPAETPESPEMPGIQGMPQSGDSAGWVGDTDITYDEEASVDGGVMLGEMSAETMEEQTRKLIHNAEYTIETLDYTQTLQDIERLIVDSGGYLQSSSQSGAGALSSAEYGPRYASMVARVPAADFFSMANALGSTGSIVYSRQYSDEVTEQYYDTTSRITALRTQETRLLELAAQAADLEAIIALEQALSEVLYELEYLQGTLRRLDDQIAYSTLYIDVQEVFEPTRVQSPNSTLGEQIADEFSDTWDGVVDGAQGFLVFVLGNSVVLLFWGALIVVAVLLVRRMLRAKQGLPRKWRKGKATDQAMQKPDDHTPDN